MKGVSSHERRGDAGADASAVHGLYSALVRDQGPSVFRYVYAAVGDRALAEDLTQDVFARAWQHIGDLRAADRARSWIFAIGANVLRDHFRRARLRSWVPLHALDHRVTPSPSQEAEIEMSASISQALQRLDDRDREMLLLVGLFEFTQREAATVVGISESAAHKRWQRARDRFLDLAAGADLS
jgi:RNA polymerase sigma-70 factor, ECF subfamily